MHRTSRSGYFQELQSCLFGASKVKCYLSTMESDKDEPVTTIHVSLVVVQEKEHIDINKIHHRGFLPE